MPSPDSLRLTIKWVVLPNGLSADGQELVFSVFIAPALTGDETGGPLTLASFPDLLDWPGTVAGIDLGVELDGSGQRVAARLLPGPRSAAVWQSVFAPSTTVLPFIGEDLTNRPVMTFSADSVLETLRHSYARLVVDAIDDLPLIAPLAEATASGARPFAAVAEALQDPVLQSLMGDRETRDATLRTLRSGGRARAGSPTGMIEVLPASDEPAGEIVRAVVFHDAQKPGPAPAADPDQAAADRAALRDSVDFHKIVSSLTEHPGLLRHLGLVIDVGVPRSAIAARTSGTVRLLPRWTSRFPSAASQKVDRSLWIAWQLDKTAALPFTAAGSRLPGVLDMGPRSPFSVHPLALDSAVLQAVAMVSALPERGARSAPPAVPSAGLTVMHADRSQAVHADLDAALQDGRGATPDTALRAHDVVRGYRLDVFDAERAGWFSLHARQVRYAKGESALLDPVLDEGAHHPSATGPAVAPGAEPGARAPLYLHESFVSWDGWSLSAPRPGRSLGVDPTGPDPDRPETMPRRTTNDPLTQAGLRIETQAQPRTLPRLRYGHRYQVRVRTVDLAGNGLDLAAVNALWQRPSVTPGASGQQVVPATLASSVVRFARFEPVPPPVIIQANPERHSTHRLVVRSATDDPALGVAGAVCRLYAPKGSVELAERHGRFDDAIGSGDLARVRASYDVAARESGVLPDAGSDELPYLPDPLAIGVAMAGAPGIVAGTTPGIEWRGPSWDRPRPITLRLEADDSHFQPPDLDQDASSITIKLEPARRAMLRISSLIPDDTPFGLLDWLGEDAVDAELDEDTRRQLRRAIDDSRHVMFTPWEELEVVHAVQRPLAAPDLRSEPDVGRRPGDTEFQPNSTLIPEPLSTGTIQLDARWTDVVDDPAVRYEPPAAGAPMPWERPVSTVVGSTTLDEPKLVGGVVPEMRRTDLYFPGSTMPRLQFSDTRHRTITLTATGMSRFADEFPELADDPKQFTRPGASAVAVARSTARPPAPVVADVVPVVSTGAVSLSTSGTLVREGGWLRIWLERPWFGSGAGEMLGVVVTDQTPQGPADPMYDYVSLAGRDAAHAAGTIPSFGTDNLLNAVAVEPRVVLPECLARLGGQARAVSVAQFAPEFDFASQRWFADIRINFFGAYFPMVRLAVVRYQPSSVVAQPLPDGTILSAHHYFVSPVVLLDPIPLFPDRRLTVQKVIKPTHALLRLELSGPAYVATSSLDSTPDAKARALARVTARPQSRLPIALAGGDEHWMNGEALVLKRDGPGKPWRLQLEDDQLRDLGPDVERILVVEEDRLPSDPAVPSPEPFAVRTVFAAVVEGPFQPAP